MKFCDVPMSQITPAEAMRAGIHWYDEHQPSQLTLGEMEKAGIKNPEPEYLIKFLKDKKHE